MPLPSFYDPAKVRDVYVERAASRRRGRRRVQAKHKVAPASQDRAAHRRVRHRLPGRLLHAGREPLRARRGRGHVAHHRVALPEPRPHHAGRVLARHAPRLPDLPPRVVDRRQTAGTRAPFTNISLADVREGKWKPIAHPAECLEYVKQLETTGKYVLTVWPYHTLLGGVSHALVPALMEAAMFHALVAPGADALRDEGHARDDRELLGALARGPRARRQERRHVQRGVLQDADGVRSRLRVRPGEVALRALDAARHAAAHRRHRSVADGARSTSSRTRRARCRRRRSIRCRPRSTSRASPTQAFAELKRAGMHIVKTTDPIA